MQLHFAKHKVCMSLRYDALRAHVPQAQTVIDLAAVKYAIIFKVLLFWLQVLFQCINPHTRMPHESLFKFQPVECGRRKEISMCPANLTSSIHSLTIASLCSNGNYKGGWRKGQTLMTLTFLCHSHVQRDGGYYVTV